MTHWNIRRVIMKCKGANQYLQEVTYEGDCPVGFRDVLLIGESKHGLRCIMERLREAMKRPPIYVDEDWQVIEDRKETHIPVESPPESALCVED